MTADRDPGAAAAPRTDPPFTKTREALSLFRSIALSGEKVNPADETLFREAVAELGAAESGASPAAEDRWHHSPDAPPEHFCDDCDRLVRLLGLAVLRAERAEAALPHGEPARHGVGMVDKVGITCLCDADFSFNSGGWVAFNRHLAGEPARTPPQPVPPTGRGHFGPEPGFIDAAKEGIGRLVMPEPARTAGDPLDPELLAVAIHVDRNHTDGSDVLHHTGGPHHPIGDTVRAEGARIAAEYDRLAALSEASSVREPGGEGDHA